MGFDRSPAPIPAWVKGARRTGMRGELVRSEYVLLLLAAVLSLAWGLVIAL